MSIELFFAALVPIVLFVIIEMKFGVRAGVIAAMVAAVLLGGYLYVRFGELDHVYLVEVALILVLGGVALKMQHGKFFKMQPMILGLIASVYIFGCQIFSDPILIRMLPLVEKIAPPEQIALIKNPVMLDKMASLSWQLGVLVLVHGLCCGWAAVKLSSVGWLWTRLAVYPALIILALFNR